MTLAVGTSQGKPLLSSIIPPLSSRFSLSVSLSLLFSLSVSQFAMSCWSVRTFLFSTTTNDLKLTQSVEVFVVLKKKKTHGISPGNFIGAKGHGTAAGTWKTRLLGQWMGKEAAGDRHDPLLVVECSIGSKQAESKMANIKKSLFVWFVFI